MPYKCVHCSNVYNSYASELMTGCASCGSKFFFYIKADKLKEIQEQNNAQLTLDEKKQMEKDVREIAGLEENNESPVFLDFESVKVLKPGKYLLDLQKLFSKGSPRIYQLEDGKYIVDLLSTSNAKREDEA